MLHIPFILVLCLISHVTLIPVCTFNSQDAGDKVLEQHFKTAKRNSTYVSARTQNELITIIGEHILATITSEVKAGGTYFSVQADELQDVANKEQLTTCIRYVRANG